MPRVFVGKTDGDLAYRMREGLDWINWKEAIPSGARVFIKPNLTFPFHKPGVTTSPEVIDLLVSILKERTPNITIGESDGGSNSWTAEEAFRGHHLPEIAQRHQVSLVNLSRSSTEEVTLPLRGGALTLELPTLLLRETDVFITVPVPKIHAMTRVSLGLKNQWGCIPAGEHRYRYHHVFDEMVCHLNRLFKTKLVVGDCTWMLTGNGPLFGEELRRDLIVVADDLGSFELTMLHLMGIQGWTVGHLSEAQGMGMAPVTLDGITFNRDWGEFRGDPFTLKRTLQNYVALAGFNSRFLTWFLYDSPLAGLIHVGLYAVKGNPIKEAIEEKEGAE
ncbi:DUF362 domain-containing protein [Gemmatimonadota bacterium]